MANPFVYWDDDLLDVVEILIHRLPPAGHAAVLRRMARDLRQHSRGFMDLFIWNENDYRFIEIKGEGDRLAAHQFEWPRVFNAVGINVSLENVARPINDRRNSGTRSRASRAM
jgi:hypothetical protein